MTATSGCGGGAVAAGDAHEVSAASPASGASTGPSTSGAIVTDPGTLGDGNFDIGPDYPTVPAGTVTPGVPKGEFHKFTLASSVIFPGIAGAYTRDVAVYVPKQYVAGTAAPFIVVQDGLGYVDHLIPVLDNLIHQHLLPTMIAVFVNPGPGDGPGSERSFEYDTLSSDYVNFIETEILPKVQKDYHFTLTTDPEGRASMGGSSGGSAALTMGWQRPDLYRRIITYSGSFVKLHPDAKNPEGAADYWRHLIPETEKKPLRIFLEVGDKDLDYPQYGSWAEGNVNMARALEKKGYHYRFLSAKNAVHVDNAMWKNTMAETLLWVWRGYPIR